LSEKTRLVSRLKRLRSNVRKANCVPILFIILGLTIFAFLPYTRTVHASTTTTFQWPAPGTADNYLRQDAATTNYGGATNIDVESRDGARNRRSILKFDMSTIPTGATVISATLSLYYYDRGPSAPTGRTYWAYRITQTAWTEDRSTWNTYDGTNSWASLGGDYTTTNGASTTVPGSYGWMSWTVTAQVQYAMNSVSKVAHFLIRDATEDSATRYQASFYSKEFGTPASRPKLDVTYAVIDRIVFTTAVQVLTAGTSSAIMTIQTNDASGAVNVPSGTTIRLTSTSAGGQFSTSSGGPWSSTLDLTITAGSSSASFYYKDTTTGTPTITAAESPSQGWTDATQQETVNPGSLASFTMSGYPVSVTAGQNFGGNNVIVTAKDAYGNVKTDYTGQVYFASTDLQAVLPYTSGSKYTFVGGDNGVHTFAGTGFTLKTTGSQFITVTDGTISATSSSITVNPAGVNKLVMTAYPSSVTAGSWTTVYTVQRQDQYGNPVTSGSTTVNLASSSTGVNKKFSESVGGPPATSVTIPDGASSKDFYYYDEKAGSWTISVSATGLTGDSKPLTVNPALLHHFTFNTISSPQISGIAFSVTITAKDAYENTVTSYAGTNTLSDTTGTISPTSTGAFTEGVWTGSVSITNVQNGVTITTTGGGKTGASNPFDVWARFTTITVTYRVTTTVSAITTLTIIGLEQVTQTVTTAISITTTTSRTVTSLATTTATVTGPTITSISTTATTILATSTTVIYTTALGEPFVLTGWLVIVGIGVVAAIGVSAAVVFGKRRVEEPRMPVRHARVLLPILCPRCRTVNVPIASFCVNCGYAFE